MGKYDALFKAIFPKLVRKSNAKKIAQALNNNISKTILPRETSTPSNNRFRAIVYKGGDIKDPYATFVTTDRQYASQYGKVTPYIIEAPFTETTEPLMGYRDPVTMDMTIHKLTNGNPDVSAVVGHDLVTGEFPYTSQGVEVLSLNPNNLSPIMPQTKKTSLAFFERPLTEAQQKELEWISKYSYKQGGKMNNIKLLKHGSGIHIKKQNRGKFTEYCGGKVTSACIAKGKNSPNPIIRKRATFADNARHFKHDFGGQLTNPYFDQLYNTNTIPASTPHSTKLDPHQLTQQLDDRIYNKRNSDNLRLELKKQIQETKNQKAMNIANSVGDFAKNISDQIQGMSMQNKMMKAGNLAEILGGQLLHGVENNQDLKNKFLTGQATAKDIYNPSNGFSTGIEFNEDGTIKSYNGKPLTDLEKQALQNYFHQQSQQLLYQKMLSQRRGGKIKKRLLAKPHQPFGNVSVLDDTGVINRKTLKLK